MKQIILTKGLPASGKSTWAKKLIDENPGMYKRVCKDDLRIMFDNAKWSPNNEKFVLKVRDEMVIQALTEGYHVILDDTNLHPKHETRMEQIAKTGEFKGKVEVKIEDFTSVSVEECIRRDLKRLNSVGEKVIRQMYRQFLQPKPEVQEYDPNLPMVILCDIDGTLALIGERNPYDASTCEQDTLNSQVSGILTVYRSEDYKVILLSGRKDTYREQTERWLKAQAIEYDALFMRQADDDRKDVILKHEMYEREIKGKYNVWFVLDDRNQVVNMWRNELGLTCLQVAEGDF